MLLLMSAAAHAADTGKASGPQPTLLDVTLNGQTMGDPRLVLRDEDGGTWINKVELRQWRLRLPECDAIEFEGETYCRIDQLPFMKVAASEAGQSLTLDAGPSLFERQTSSLAGGAPTPMTPATSGAFLNYDLFAEHSRGATTISGAFEAGIFTRYGVGTTSFIASAGDGGKKLLRLETSWTIDRPGKLSSIRIGDSVTVGGPHAFPVRFAGLQYGRNFAIQPGFVTMPLPSLEGSAAVRSVVDIYVDNALRGSQEVQPGPFQVTNVPVSSGGGNVNLVVRDALGREVVTSLPYYASATMLQKHLHDFSYEIGFERKAFGYRSNSYGAFIASASHRYGVSDRLTVEGHAEASRSHQLASAAATAAWPHIGLVTASAAVSHSPRGVGAAVGASFERRTQGLSLGLHSELTTAHFNLADLPTAHRGRVLTLQGFADLPTRWGSFGVNLLQRSFGHGGSESLIGATASVGLGRRGTLQFYANRSVLGHAEISVGVNLALSFGGRRSGTAGFERHGGANLATLSYQDDPPAGSGSGYHVAATRGSIDSIEAGYRLQTSFATIEAQAAHVNGSTGVRLSMSGAIGVIQKHAFVSRALGTSFGIVQVPGQPGVRVYADNQLVGVTGKDGNLVIPALRAYEDNLIRVDAGDLPMDVQIPNAERDIRPYARSGATIRFAVKRERGALLHIALEDGAFVPAGSEAIIDGTGEAYLVASGGEVYVPDMEGEKRFSLSHDGRTCFFSATMPEGDDPQPRIDGIVCKDAERYVSR